MVEDASVKRLCTILCVLAAVVAGACSPGDSTNPAQPTLTLAADARRFEWTATGDDGNAYWALVSDLRFIDYDLASDAGALGLFEDLIVARQLLGEPLPRASGRPEFFVAPRIDSLGLYHHFLQIRDEVSNPSALGSLGGVPSDLVAFNPIQHTLRNDLADAGALEINGDVNGDEIADLVASDPGNELLYVYFGRDAYPFHAVDAEIGGPMDEAEPSTGKVGDCTSVAALERYRLCSPDLVIDAGALGGRFGGRSVEAESSTPVRTVSSLAVSDIDDDDRDEIIVGAPEFMAHGEMRGAVFVLDFEEDFISTRQGTSPETGRNSWVLIHNPTRVENFVGRVTRADARGVLVDDILPDDQFPADMSAGVPFDAPVSERQSWRLYEGDPIRAFRRESPISCPAGDTVPCTGDAVTVTPDLRVVTDNIGIQDVGDGLLLVLLDPATGAPTFSAEVRRVLVDEPGLFSRIEIWAHTATPDLSALASAGGDSFALYREVARGSNLPTTTRSGIEAGAPGNPLELGNFLASYDPGDAATVIRLLDPAGVRVTPDPDLGERYPEVTLLGPEAGGNFGDVVDAGADLNFDEIPDLAIGAPTLTDAPSRYANTMSLDERGGVYVLFGDEDLAQLDAAGQGQSSDGIFDFGPEGVDRPSSLILGRNEFEHLGWAISGTRFRQNNPAFFVRNELALPVVTLAVGAPGACPRAPSDETAGCGAEDQVGAVYLFVGDRFFESRDYRPPGGTPDGVWDLAGDPSAELDGAAELSSDYPNARVAAQVALPSERADVEIWGEVDGDQLGFAVMLDADLNGDHVYDLVVGAPGAGVSDEGQVLVFLGSTSEVILGGFSNALLTNAERTGLFTSSRPYNFRGRGNLDFDQRIDTNANGFAETIEDRCVFCVYDLSADFPVWASGPDIRIDGGMETQVGRSFDAGFYNNDAYEDLAIHIRNEMVGDWIGFINGKTSLLIESRNIDLFRPLDSPQPSNFEEGGSAGSPVGVPGSSGSDSGVTWWVGADQGGGLIHTGQVFVDVQTIYEDTRDGSAGISGENIAFGRAATDETSELTTTNTAELLLYFRAFPDNIDRWNVLTHGGFFAEGASMGTPFVGTTLDAFVVGGDHNEDGRADVGMIIGGTELRIGH